MTFKKLNIIMLCFTCFCSSGCATVLTRYFPIKVTETKNGEKVLGEQVAYNYSLTETKDSLVLLRQPLCSQKIKRITVEKNMMHGITFALLEVPFFGLGLIDMAFAQEASDATLKESDGGTINSSEIIVCGNDAVAPNVELILEFPESASTSFEKTDEHGKILFSSIRNSTKKDSQYIIFVKEKGGVSYVQTVERKYLELIRK